MFCHSWLSKNSSKLEHIFQDLWLSSDWICWELFHLAIFPGCLSKGSRLPFLRKFCDKIQQAGTCSLRCFVYKFCRSICHLSDRMTVWHSPDGRFLFVFHETLKRNPQDVKLMTTFNTQWTKLLNLIRKLFLTFYCWKQINCA